MTTSCSCGDGDDFVSHTSNYSPTQISIVDADYQYGFHVTKYPSMLKTILRITRETPLTALQVYISSPKSKYPPKFDYDDLLASRNEIERSQIYTVIHGCLLYNLAGTVKGSSDDNYEKSLSSTLQGLIAELDFGVMLGGTTISTGVIVHPGARDSKFHKPTLGIKCISDTINIALTRETNEAIKIAKLLNIQVKDVISRRKIILENAAGEGNKLCSTLEEIAEVIKGVDKKLRSQVKVCIDTQHAYAKGLYDWGKKSDINRFYKDFDKIIGLEYLELFHFNDSMRSDQKASNAPFGGRKDRHQQLTEGYIFDVNDSNRVECIPYFMMKAKDNKIALIGEPPTSGMQDWIIACGLLEKSKYPLVEVVEK